MNKKIQYLLLASSMMLSISACSAKEYEADFRFMAGMNIDVNSKPFVSKDKNTELLKPDATLNAQDIYANLTYIPEMFYGKYDYQGICSLDAEDYADFFENMTYCEQSVVYKDGTSPISELPFAFTAGSESWNHVLNRIESRDWMNMYFYTESKLLVTVYGAYTINGNILSFYPLAEYSYDRDTDTITYELSENSLDYEFAFQGHELTLTKNNISVTLQAESLSNNYRYLSIEGYSWNDNAKIDDITGFQFYSNTEDTDSEFVLINLSNGDTIRNACAYFNEDGILTFSWTDEDAIAHAYQYVYFCCGRDGLILTDGKNTYCYTQSYWGKCSDELLNNLDYADLEKIENTDETVLETVIDKKNSLFDALANAFATANIDVSINRANGEIALNDTVLFATNEYTLSDAGEEKLSAFMKVYASVLQEDDYKDFVSKVLVEGHTDTSGSYQHNLKLSQKRADTVKDYCISVLENDISNLFQSVGYSYDRPVYDANGEIDAQASRRVAFRFVITLT